MQRNRNRKSHVLDYAEVLNYEFEHRIAGDHGDGVNKSLDAWVSGGHVHWKVYSQREVVGRFNSLAAAVEAYNSI